MMLRRECRTTALDVFRRAARAGVLESILVSPEQSAPDTFLRALSVVSRSIRVMPRMVKYTIARSRYAAQVGPVSSSLTGYTESVVARRQPTGEAGV